MPKTIDGDLKNDDIAISFGFDTACKVWRPRLGETPIGGMLWSET